MEFLTYLVDFILHIDTHLFELVEQYGMWIYAILFIIVFCETGLVVTPFLPGDSLLFASGVVAGTGLMGYGHVLLVLLAAGIMGDAVNYFIGRHVGPAIFQRDSRFIKKEHLLKAHHFYEKHGGKAIILARFVPIVRTFAPFVAGIALMCPHRFFLFNITIAIYQVKIEDHTVTIVNQHMESIGLTQTDKELYHEITAHPNTDRLDEIKKHLLSKLMNAAEICFLVLIINID